MLVAPSIGWRGTSGRSFKTIAEFAEYFLALQFVAWKPIGVMIHNTASPDGAQWDATTPSTDPEVDGRQRLLNLTDYYRNPAPPYKTAWQGGPNMFIDDDRAFEFTPLNVHGTHSPNYNATHIGIEMVGDFNREPFDSGRGAVVRDFTVGIVAAIMSARGMDPDKLLFHKDDPAGHQDCPGKNVKKGEMISRIKIAMSGGDFNGHVVDNAPVVVSAASDAQKAFEALKEKLKPDTPQDEAAVMMMQAALNANGASLTIDGWRGNMTNAALAAYKGS